MKTLFTILMLLAGCSPVMVGKKPKATTDKLNSFSIYKSTAELIPEIFNLRISTRTLIYVIYDWKEFCENWGHNWKEAWVYPRDGDIRYFNSVKGYECRYCKAKKRDVTEEEIWWEE